MARVITPGVGGKRGLVQAGGECPAGGGDRRGRIRYTQGSVGIGDKEPAEMKRVITRAQG